MILKSKYVIPVNIEPIEDGAIFIEGDTIKDVGYAKDIEIKYPNEEIKDLGLAALMPGLVNTHTHIAFSALRGLFEDMPYVEWKRACLAVEPLMERSDWINSARLGTLESIASGITTVADFSRSAESFDAIRDSKMRSIMYVGTSTMHQKYANEVVQNTLKTIDDLSNESHEDLINFGIGAGHTYACHPEVYSAIADAVEGTDMRVAMHLACCQEETDFVKYGSSPLSIHASKITQGLKLDEFGYFPWLPSGTTPVRYVYNWRLLQLPNVLVIHGVHVDDDDISFLAKSKAAISFCPRINAKLGMGLTPVSKYLEAGITVGLGTDSPAAVTMTDMIAEMRFGLMLTRARDGSSSNCYMTGDTMLKMATIKAAKALGLDDKIGSLEIGKKADIIAIDLHNSHQVPTSDPAGAVIYTANQDNVMMTMINGEILYDSFTFKPEFNRSDVIKEASALRKRLRKEMTDDELIKSRMKSYTRDLSERFKR